MRKDIENLPRGSRFPRDEMLGHLKLNAEGLIPAIAQQHDTGEVLMMAWMNAEALEETLTTGRVCYFSRSRGRLWRKGESSGQIQRLKGLYIDCDGDTLLLRVDQTGPACHTGRSNCFFLRVDGHEMVVTTNPLIDPETLYGNDPASSRQTPANDPI
nr:phosphoribosyl-AMP cyclohydrolase [Thioalkalivibrio sp.]